VNLVIWSSGHLVIWSFGHLVIWLSLMDLEIGKSAQRRPLGCRKTFTEKNIVRSFECVALFAHAVDAKHLPFPFFGPPK